MLIQVRVAAIDSQSIASQNNRSTAPLPSPQCLTPAAYPPLAAADSGDSMVPGRVRLYYTPSERQAVNSMNVLRDVAFAQLTLPQTVI
jgi:hypothetical protein